MTDTLEMTIQREAVKAKTRTLTARWTLDQVQDERYIDQLAVEYLTSELAKQLKESIQKENKNG